MEKENLHNIHRVNNNSLEDFIKSYEMTFKRKWKLICISPAIIINNKVESWLVIFENTDFL